MVIILVYYLMELSWYCELGKFTSLCKNSTRKKQIKNCQVMGIIQDDDN